MNFSCDNTSTYPRPGASHCVQTPSSRGATKPGRPRGNALGGDPAPRDELTHFQWLNASLRQCYLAVALGTHQRLYTHTNLPNWRGQPLFCPFYHQLMTRSAARMHRSHRCHTTTHLTGLCERCILVVIEIEAPNQPPCRRPLPRLRLWCSAGRLQGRDERGSTQEKD